MLIAFAARWSLCARLLKGLFPWPERPRSDTRSSCSSATNGAQMAAEGKEDERVAAPTPSEGVGGEVRRSLADNRAGGRRLSKRARKARHHAVQRRPHSC